MNTYTHLSVEERTQIYKFKQQGLSHSEVARRIFRNKSTISREWKRNRHRGHLYIPVVAHSLSKRRRSERPIKRKFSGKTISFIKTKIEMKWSPEQISGRLKKEHGIKVSHEWIYQLVLRDKKSGGSLYKNLRQGHRKRRKRYGVSREKRGAISGEKSREKRGAISGEKSIENRPKIVDSRERFGDWEGDTVIGSSRKASLATLTERKSLLCLLRKVPQKTAQKVREAMVESLKPFGENNHTVTFDRGSEFSEHRKIEKALDIEVYFAHPYSSYERGTNENLNGLVRQYLPKKSSFEDLSPKEVERIEFELNSRPRKKLGYKTPIEVCVEELGVLGSVNPEKLTKNITSLLKELHQPVALQT